VAIKPKERLTAQEWFDIGDRTEFAAYTLLAGKPNEILGLIGHSHIMLRSFAIEAYLKCLVEMDERKPTKIHNLWGVFSQLRPEDRRALRKRWRQDNGPALKALNKQKGTPFAKVPVGLDGVLKVCGDAFTVVRYLPAEGMMPFLLMNFSLGIREHILATDPSLRPLVRFLHPEPKLVKTKDNQRGPVGTGWAVFNRQPAPFDIKVRRSSDANDGGSGKAG
jgi:hypothetical protein